MRHRRVVGPLAQPPRRRGDHVAQRPAVAVSDLVGVQPLDGGAERIADREPEHGAARAVVHPLGVAPPDHADWHPGQWYVRRA